MNRIAKLGPPPDAWKYKMEKKLRKQYGDNDEAVFATINKIWKNLKSKKRTEIRKRRSFTDLAMALKRIARRL